MSRKSIFCIATTRTQAEKIVESLEKGNYPLMSVSVLFSGNQVPGIEVGSPPEGDLERLPGIDTLQLPGTGTFFASGPLMAALSGSVLGSKTGGIASALMGMGIPELESQNYEAKVKSGSILISVYTEKQHTAMRVKNVFTNAAAQDISTTGETAALSHFETADL